MKRDNTTRQSTYAETKKQKKHVHFPLQLPGISPDNEDEVRRLSTESKFELAVRKAAMLMYWKLNPDRKPKVAMTEMLQNVSQVNTKPGTENTHTGQLRSMC